MTGDIFEKITPGAIPFASPHGRPENHENRRMDSKEPAQTPRGLSIRMGGPWSFYADFRQEHGIAGLPHPEPPEIALQAGTALVIPLWVTNETAATRQFTLSVDVPAGWAIANGAGTFSIGANQTDAARVEVNLPAAAEADKKPAEMQEVTVRAESDGKSIGTVKMRVELRKRALPE
jgi:hypothetical protein